jgi:hypothetical protein
VVGAITTCGSPSAVTPGSSQGQAFTIRSQTSSGSADLEDVLRSAAGTQDARAIFAASTDWYAMGDFPGRTLRRRTQRATSTPQVSAAFSFPAPISQNCR